MPEAATPARADGNDLAAEADEQQQRRQRRQRRDHMAAGDANRLAARLFHDSYPFHVHADRHLALKYEDNR